MNDITSIKKPLYLRTPKSTTVSHNDFTDLLEQRHGDKLPITHISYSNAHYPYPKGQ